MHQKFLIRSAIIIFALYSLVTLLAVNTVSAEDSVINCQAHDGSCSLPIGNETVTLEIMPRPVTAMKDSTFTVIQSGKLPERASFIDLANCLSEPLLSILVCQL